MKPSFFRHAFTYAAGNFLLQAGSFLLLPLYLRGLSREEFGTLEILRRFADVAVLLLLVGGVRQALVTFHGQAQDDRERAGAVGSALAVTFLALSLGGSLLCVLGGSFQEWIGVESKELFTLGLVAVFLEVFVLLLLAVVHVRLQPHLYVAISVGDFLLRTVLSLILVLGYGWGLSGVLAAAAFSSALAASVLVVREFLLGMRVCPRQAWGMVCFALPFVPAGMGFFLLHNGDRFFLLRSVTPAEVGVYALGYKLALVVPLFSRSPLYLVWSNRMYAAARQPDAAVVFGRVFLYILGAYLGVGLAVCLLGPAVVAILGGDRYAGAATVVPPVVLAYFFLAAADLMEAGLYVTRQTAWKLPVTALSTLVILGLYALLIPEYGTFGAALATLVAFFVHAVATWAITQRVFPVSYEWPRVGGALGLAVVLWFVGSFLPVAGWGTPARVAVVFLGLPIAWNVGLLSSQEKAWLRDRAGSALTRLRRRNYDRVQNRRMDARGTPFPVAARNAA